MIINILFNTFLTLFWASCGVSLLNMLPVDWLSFGIDMSLAVAHATLTLYLIMFEDV